MIEWTDDAIVLSARRHGESAAIVSLLTQAHGRHAGLVHGGAGRRARGIYQPGNRVTAGWRERLLPLPAFLTGNVPDAAIPSDGILSGLRLTGYFLDQHVFAHRPAEGAD